VLAKQAVLSAKFNCQGPEVLQLADLKFGDGLPGELRLQAVSCNTVYEALDSARLSHATLASQQQEHMPLLYVSALTTC